MEINKEVLSEFQQKNIGEGEIGSGAIGTELSGNTKLTAEKGRYIQEEINSCMVSDSLAIFVSKRNITGLWKTKHLWSKARGDTTAKVSSSKHQWSKAESSLKNIYNSYWEQVEVYYDKHYLLNNDNTFLLLENGGKILLESSKNKYK